MEKDMCVKCTCRKYDEKTLLVTRLSKIEGQVRGIKKMIEDDRYCDDILIQLSAIDKSLKSLRSSFLKTRLSTCVAEEIKKGNNDVVEKIISLFKKLE